MSQEAMDSLFDCFLYLLKMRMRCSDRQHSRITKKVRACTYCCTAMSRPRRKGGHCLLAFYCNESCQLSHWQEHKGLRVITRLLRGHRQTLGDRSFLCGLVLGVLRIIECEALDSHFKQILQEVTALAPQPGLILSGMTAIHGLFQTTSSSDNCAMPVVFERTCNGVVEAFLLHSRV
jgi:hypothetical protein